MSGGAHFAAVDRPSAPDAALVTQAQAGKKSWPKAEWVDPNRTEPNGTKYRTFASKVLGAEVSWTRQPAQKFLLMVPHRATLPEESIEAVVHWLRSLPAAGAAFAAC